MQPSDFYIFKNSGFLFLEPVRTSSEISLSRGGAFPVTGWRGAGALGATEETEVALSPPIAAVKPGA